MKKERFIPLFIVLSLVLAFQTAPASALADTPIETQGKQDESYSLKYQKIQLVKSKQRIIINGDLKGKSVSLKSSNTSVLRVNNKKKNSLEVMAVSPGAATVTIKITDDSGLFFMNDTKTFRAKIKVTPRAASVKFKKSTYKLSVGQSQKLKITLRPSISKEIPIYSSKKPSVVTVDAKGVVTAKKTGVTYVYAMISNKVKAKCKIVVN